MTINIKTEVVRRGVEDSLISITINDEEYVSTIRNHSLKHPELVIRLFVIPALEAYAYNQKNNIRPTL